MIVERRLSAHLDWPLIFAILALAVLGLATVYSVKWDFVRDQPGPEFWKQVYAIPVGLVALVACLVIDYRTLAQRSLSNHVRFVRRRVSSIEGRLELRDGSETEIDAESLIAAEERGLRLLAAGSVVLAAAMVAFRL